VSGEGAFPPRRTRATRNNRTAGSHDLPTLLNTTEVADLLRTSRKAVWAMVERGQLPGVVRIRRRVLVRKDALLDWLHQQSASSLQGA
jgi:excisionase family DNA binding protein